MDDQKKIIERLQTASNILVTVSSNPSLDQLAACIGLTLSLNKLDKHSTAVFSGDVPDTIEFLKPEKTLEKSADSLRDFIISLDKAKADKLRYKVEDKVVKIFITPYRTSLSEDDLYFTQGDYNVDVVMALGVSEQRDLDQAITSHGRILHDATVISINCGNGKGGLGSINWRDNQASSLSEMVSAMVKQLDKKALDGQISTAFLTGIVAETDRFRNQKTTAQSLSVSADLMSAGANQQLITSQLDHSLNVRASDNTDEVDKKAKQHANKPTEKDDGTTGALEVDHDGENESEEKDSTEESISSSKEDSQPNQNIPLPPPTEQPVNGDLPKIHGVHSLPDENKEPEPYHKEGEDVKSAVDESAFNSNQVENYSEDSDEITNPPTNERKLLSHDSQPQSTPDVSPKPVEENIGSGSLDFSLPQSSPAPTFDEEEPKTAPPSVRGGLDDYLPLKSEPTPPAKPANVSGDKENTQQAPELPAEPKQSQESESSEADSSQSEVDAARSDVMRALSEQSDDNLPPIEGLNAQDLGETLHGNEAVDTETENNTQSASPSQPNLTQSSPRQEPPQNFAAQPNQTLDMPTPPSSNQAPPPPPSAPSGLGQAPPTSAESNQNGQNPPPPVPPPMMPPNLPGPGQSPPR